MNESILKTMVFSFDFFKQLIVCCIVFSFALNKKTHYVIRGIASIIVAFMFQFPIYYCVYFGHMWIYFVVPVILGFIFFYVTCDISVPDCLYATMWAYAVQHISNTVANIIKLVCFKTEHASIMVPISALDVIAFIVVLLLAFFIIVRKIAREGSFGMKYSQSLFVCGMLLIFGFGINFWTRTLYDGMDSVYFLPPLLYDLVCCIYVLWLQRITVYERKLYAEYVTESRLRNEQQKQFENTKYNIEAINRRSHDIKHQISALKLENMVSKERISEIEEEINDYDSSVKTGNHNLDIILTEKAIACKAQRINCSFLVDGHLLDRIDTVDLFVLFGNALDNAIEASVEIQDETKRSISVTVHEQAGMARIEVWNYTAKKPVFVEGVPFTTKKEKEFHGYGTKSMRGIVNKYDGKIIFSHEDGIYRVRILLPI